MVKILWSYTIRCIHVTRNANHSGGFEASNVICKSGDFKRFDGGMAISVRVYSISVDYSSSLQELKRKAVQDCEAVEAIGWTNNPGYIEGGNSSSSKPVKYYKSGQATSVFNASSPSNNLTPVGTCRYDSSLGLLTKRFLNLLKRAQNGILDLNNAAHFGGFRMTTQGRDKSIGGSACSNSTCFIVATICFLVWMKFPNPISIIIKLHHLNSITRCQNNIFWLITPCYKNTLCINV